MKKKEKMFVSAPLIDQLIGEELEKAKKKFPRFPIDPVHAAAVVAEEAGELVKASLEYSYEALKATRADMIKEAIQTAAMAIRFLETSPYMKIRQSDQVR